MPARCKSKMTGRANFYQHGTNNVECDRTGFKLKATDCKKEWNGFFVWKEVYEDRQPLDFLKGFPDRQQPAVSRPGTGEDFITSVQSSSAVTANDAPPQVIFQNTVKPEDL